MSDSKKPDVRRCCSCKAIKMREDLTGLVSENYKPGDLVPERKGYCPAVLRINGFGFTDSYFSKKCMSTIFGGDDKETEEAVNKYVRWKGLEITERCPE